MKRALLWLILAFVLILIAPRSRGAPPQGYNHDSELAQWYRSLVRPDTGGSCCDRSDCREVQIRIGPKGYEALLEPKVFPVAEPEWVTIPNDKIIRGKENLPGRPVMCWTPSMGVICFVEGSGV